MKTYKGIELFKAVGNYELKNGTKLKCVHSGLYGQGVEVAEDEQILIWSDNKEPISYAHFDDRAFEFEIIEEKPKKIEKLPKHITDNACASKDLREIANKINEIIDYLLDKGDK